MYHEMSAFICELDSRKFGISFVWPASSSQHVPYELHEKQMLALRVTYLVSYACCIGRRIANYSFRSKLSKADFFSPIRAE